MDFDPRELDADLANLLAEEDRQAELDSKLDQEDEQFYNDLVAQARVVGFVLPNELLAEAGTVEEKPVSFQEFEAIRHSSESQSTKLENVCEALSNLSAAKAFATYGAPNDDFAIEARDGAIGVVFGSDEFDETEKDSFLTLVNTYLTGLVDPLELPTPISGAVAPGIKSELGRSFMNAADERSREAAHNAAILGGIRPKIGEVLRAAIGEHDDMSTLRENVVHRAALLCIERQIPDSSPDSEVTLDEILLHDAFLEDCAEKYGIDINVLAQLVAASFATMQSMGFRII